jgi:hypothetical protein
VHITCTKSSTIDIAHYSNLCLSSYRQLHSKVILRIVSRQNNSSFLVPFRIRDSRWLLNHRLFAFVVITRLSLSLPSRFWPSAYIGCWWDLRRDFRFIILPYPLQSQWHLTLHSYASNCCNTRRSRSVPPIIVYTLISYDTTYLWSSLRSFPILWPCSLPFHCKSSFYIPFNIAYFWSLTITLLIHCTVVISRAFASVIPFA